MRLDKFTVQYTRTINLGDYNSIKLSIMPTIHLDANDDEAEVLEAVWAMCRQNVEHAARPIVHAYHLGDTHGVASQELFLGLPVELTEQKEIEHAD